MKKLFVIICSLFVGIANADNVITSKEYVDTHGAALQPQISAKNTNTVLTYPAAGTDTPGEKAIYDSSAAYGEQTDALVTAGQFNTALQTALDTEFVCISRNDQGCLLYEIRTSSPNKFPSPANQTQTVAGVTISVDNGVYKLSGSANTETTICFHLTEPYTFPISLDKGGNAVMYLWNDSANDTLFISWLDTNQQKIDHWMLIPNRIVTRWTTQENKTAEYVCFTINGGTELNDFRVAPMIVENGITTYEHFMPHNLNYLPSAN